MDGPAIGGCLGATACPTRTATGARSRIPSGELRSTQTPAPRRSDTPSIVSARWVPWAVTSFSIALLALISLWGIGRCPFWRDEVWSIEVAWPRLGGHASAHLAAPRPIWPLYYVTLSGWLKIGTSEAFVRTLSVIFALATVPVTFLLARRLYGAFGAWCDCRREQSSLSPVLAIYAQEARSYTLVALLAATSTLFFVRALDRRDRRIRALYGVTAAALVYLPTDGGTDPSSCTPPRC